VKFTVSLGFLLAHYLFFKGAHGIAALSWFFCVMTKGQEKKNLDSRILSPVHQNNI